MASKLPDFMSALRMRPSHLPESGQSRAGDVVAMDTDGKSETSLLDKYRKGTLNIWHIFCNYLYM